MLRNRNTCTVFELQVCPCVVLVCTQLAKLNDADMEKALLSFDVISLQKLR